MLTFLNRNKVKEPVLILETEDDRKQQILRWLSGNWMGYVFEYQNRLWEVVEQASKMMWWAATDDDVKWFSTMALYSMYAKEQQDLFDGASEMADFWEGEFRRLLELVQDVEIELNKIKTPPNQVKTAQSIIEHNIFDSYKRRENGK